MLVYIDIRFNFIDNKPDIETNIKTKKEKIDD